MAESLSAFNRVTRLEGGVSSFSSGSSHWVTPAPPPPQATPTAPIATAQPGAPPPSVASPMKVPVRPPPLKSLPPLAGYGPSAGVPVSPLAMDRLPLPLTLPFSPDLLWRYPLGVPSSQQPSSPLFDVKTQLPGALGPEPRSWNREDVVTFLRWCEREFDLPPLDLDKFQMNGKALVLLNKSDIAERAPGAGDVIHNALQLLLRDSPYSRAATGAGPVPSSPLTHSYPFANNQAQGSQSGHLILSPPASARTPTSASWPAPASIFASADLHNLGHIIQQTNSVTLSPSPSVDSNSQAGSPSSHAEQQQHHLAAAQAAAQAHLSFYAQAMQAHQLAGANGSNSGSQSDSEESVQDSSPRRSPAPSSSSAMHANPPASPAALSKDLQASGSGGETLDSASNGRLLWDFLQQLLNDPSQRYSAYIAWKNRETGVFKITDPAGLARLWGIQKNHPSMNYDKMSRALRYYYRVNILRKVQGERHCYQFLRNPVELKSIKNISLLRQQMAAAAAVSAPSIGSSSNNNAKLADSTDCSAERYSPSSSSTAAHNNNNSGSHLPDDCPETKERNFASYDCDMPTDLTMESCERRSNNNHYLATVKHEKVAS